MRAKSQKSSGTSTRRPKCPVIFIDRTFGDSQLAGELRRIGFRLVETHCKHFKSREKDEVWIIKVGLKNWRILTQDKDLETRHHEAIVRGNAGVFIMSDVKPKEGLAKWVEILTTCRERIVHASTHGKRPFVARISYEGNLYRVNHLMPRMRTVDITETTASHAATIEALGER